MRKIVLVLTSLVLVVATVGGAFAVWLFDREDRLNEQLSKVDTIYENYSYGDEKLYSEKTYTMYIYPSAVYLNEYIKYLNDTSTDKKTIEEVYGWLDVHVNADGNVTYTAHPGIAKVSGSPLATGDYIYLQLMQDYNNRGDYGLGVTLGQNQKNDTSGGFNPYGAYTNHPDWDQTVTVSVDGKDVSYKKYEIGDPELDKTVLACFQPINNGLSGYDNWEWNRYSMRNLHLNDRFGCWNDIAFGAGRYLPIKITVDATFSTELFNQIVKTSTCDFGDYDSSFHDFLLAGRSYVKWEGNKWTVPRYADSKSSTDNILKAFHNYRVENYFDITRHFQEYADPNDIIRLFPFYSNGTNDRLTLRNEKKSALRASVVYPDDPSDFQYTDNLSNGIDVLARMIKDNLSKHSYSDRFRTLFYLMDSISNYQNSAGEYTTSNVKYTVYPNLNLDKLVVTNADGTVSAGTLDIHCSPEKTDGTWEGNWYRVYSLSSDVLKKIKDKYGSGLYNLYIFVGNSGDYTYTQTSLSNILSNADKFSGLSGKNLINLSEVGFENSATSIQKGGTGYTPLYICLEKVQNIKVIGNLSTTSTDADIQTAYKNEDVAFRRITDGVFSSKENNVKVSKEPTDYPRTLVNFSYCYLLRNVDFIDSNTAYFQIRSEKKALSLKENKENDTPLIYSPGASVTGEIKLTSNQVFEPAIGTNRFFKVIKDEDTTCNGVLLMLNDKLNDKDLKGTYDIIIYSDSADNYYVYAYRQTNSFIKIFASDPGIGIKSETETGEAGTRPYSKHKESSNLLFEKSYWLGERIKETDEMEESIGSLSGDKVLKDVLDTYLKGLGSKSGNIRDSVTGAVVGVYSYDGANITVTFKDFPIRKNYVFYLEPDSKT